ncbi:ABC transporter permease [Bacillus pseudomycoides]|uniref:ABC transporter permease n=1 Tax=Bacillus pseudomycoides TaxID=64104 RepID=A0AA91VB88_9BACI|nr:MULTISPECIES: ABC transporter permease subunit [Bacillus]PEB56833.1 ABC transporter permease [Bacillus sp. AFS098217]PED82051.1 ABC transporter permease [Bacillus pseudomycoides]PEU06553.1 ABC transporter permease [Bacillus sp. AFS019443]PEU18475.1 ABC transporter permease [Bacillus sp. AFS014408]PFW62867.1 ABC transporter permease [Bacillus sp. AFS075034]
MNKQLFLASFKENSKSIWSYAIGAALYLWLLIWIFPSLVSAKGLNELIGAMPESVKKIVGMETSIQNVSQFLAGEYYGMLFIIILTIFSVTVATHLMARYVDKGAMAYLLATPVSRVKIAITQAVVLILGLLIITLATYGAGVLGAEWFLKDNNLNQELFFKMNLVGGLVFLVVSAYSFLFSCLCNDERKALSYSASLTILFYVLNMVGKLSDKLEWMRNISLFSLFRPEEIVAGTYNIWPVSIGLTCGAIVIFIVAIVSFKKRDLPL